MKVAVCIPTWNRAKTISIAINSLINQKKFEFDIHIFDNASTDNTEEIIKENYSNKV
jgi:glycosyltransferase involved in cell wall biosynthesis